MSKPTKALIEAEAKAIYEKWSSEPDYLPWVNSGTSYKQDEARRIAVMRSLQVEAQAKETARLTMALENREVIIDDYESRIEAQAQRIAELEREKELAYSRGYADAAALSESRIAELEAALEKIEYLDRPQVRELPRRKTIQQIALEALGKAAG